MLKMFKNIGKKDLFFMLLCLLFIVVQVWLDLKLPDYMSDITRMVQTKGSSVGDVIVSGLYMLGCALGSLLSACIVGYFSSLVGTRFSMNLRKKIFSKIESFGLEEIKKFSTSSLITRNTNDVRQVQSFVVMGLQMIVKAPIMAVWAISKIANKGFLFSIITGVGVAVVLVMIISLIILVLPKFKIVQSLTDNLNRIIRENLTGIRVIRAYNAEEFQSSRFNDANTKLTSTQMFTQKAMSLIGPVMNLVMSSISLSIYFVGAHLINDATMVNKITIFGDMVVFSSYAIQVIMSFMMLVMIFIIYPRASVSAKRINEVLDTDIKIKDGKIDHDTTNTSCVVEFRDVSFKYPDAKENILSNISFKASKGEVVAFVGGTGSGKSTLVNLIPRFYDVTSGEVLVDGVNVKNMTLTYLYDKIGYISQKAVLFKGTIRENVSFGKVNGVKPSTDMIEKAISISKSDFVNKLDDSYDAKVSQGGINFSGGQKQRLSIARAIARNPKIYIFDDSFSALDFKTDFSLRSELAKYTKDATIFIVAQRIGTIISADKIVVLDEGKCVGIGSHKELLKSCDVYRQIASSQLSKEELDNE